MKFKVGDMVRLTRDCLWAKILAGAKIDEQEMFWFSIEKMDNSVITSPYPNYHESVIELVPEEPEFAEGEWVEVSNDGKNWEKSLFVHKLSRYSDCPYICVREWNEPEFKEGFSFDTKTWKYARKPRPQLTRKEIAEKFWVSENFVLVD